MATDDEPENVPFPPDSDSLDVPANSAQHSADFVQCPHCRKYFWEGAAKCPRCGHDVVRDSWLKKPRWLVITAIILLIVLFGGGVLWFILNIPLFWSLAPAR